MGQMGPNRPKVSQNETKDRTKVALFALFARKALSDNDFRQTEGGSARPAPAKAVVGSGRPR